MIDPAVYDEWPTPAGGWPRWVGNTLYVAAAHPQQPIRRPIEDGANCQRYAYAVLELFGRGVSNHRSSDLWEDPAFDHPTSPADLDLVLFNSDDSAWGAHVGVVLTDAVLHLSAEVGEPAVWSWQRFAARPRYHTVVGFVRVPESR